MNIRFAIAICNPLVGSSDVACMFIGSKITPAKKKNDYCDYNGLTPDYSK